MKFRSAAWWVWGSLGVIVGLALLAKLAVPSLAMFFATTEHLESRRSTSSPAPVTSVAQSTRETPAIGHGPVLPTPASAPARRQPVWLAVPPGAVATQPLKFDVGALPYEAALGAILQAPVPNAVKAQALFALLPQVPEESMASTAEQAAALLRDRDYARIALPWIVSPKTHGAVLGALFADLMERPDAVALPTLVEIAKTPDHPFAPSAHDNLTLLVGQDFGIDWPAWDKAVLQKLNTPAPTP